MSPIFFSKVVCIFLALVIQFVKGEGNVADNLVLGKVPKYSRISLDQINGTTETPNKLHVNLNTTTVVPFISKRTLLTANNVSSTTESPISSISIVNASTTKIPEIIQATETPLNSSNSTNLLTPKAISVNIPDGQVQMLYQKTQDELKTKLKGDEVEETFTYQVKRLTQDIFSGKSFTFKSPWGGVIKDQDQEIAQQTHKLKENEENRLTEQKISEMNDKLQQLEGKMSSFIAFTSELEKKQNSSSQRITSTYDHFKKQLDLLNKTLSAQSSLTKEIQNTVSFQKDRLEGQVQTLSMHFRHMQNQTSEQILQGTRRLDHLTSIVQNTTHEVRLNEVRTRYNQKALTTLDRLVQSNNEKLVEISTAEGGPRWTEQTSGCGGIVIGEEGVISYKFRQPYLNNEKCIWTLRSNRRSRIVLQLLEDGFQNSSNSDFITVTEFADDQPTSLVTSSRIENGNRAIHTFRGPLIFLTFHSDSSVPGNGFILKYKGEGNASAADLPNSIRYRHFHLNDPNGHVTYPDEKNLLYQPNEITTFIINPPSSAVTVHLRYTDLEKEQGCEYDSISFYGSVRASFALAKKYCEQQEVYTGEALQSSDGTFIIVFRSDASTQFKGFQFSWEKF